ncbi:MAG: TetR/AcrR family transcriptional regulator, partial [Streptomyces sp.]|nr:TetR/AcrR family transcriptional regulator [Streptomyces sp.]
GLGHIHADNGLARRALRDLEVGIASGRFTALDPVVALTALGGTLLALLELRFARPEVDGDEAAVNLAEMVLRMLGVPADDAHEVARRPLPDLG